MRSRSAKPEKSGSHPDNYLLQSPALPFFQRQSQLFSPPSHSTHSDERNRIQVIQNKQSASRSLDTLVKGCCGNFRTRIWPVRAVRGSTEWHKDDHERQRRQQRAKDGWMATEGDGEG